MAQEAATRRAVLPGLAVTVAAAAAGYGVTANSSAADAKSVTAAANGGATAPDTQGPLAQLADIPQNGGLVLRDEGIVLTRDGGDNVHGFSAVCTHQGCTVSSVDQGQIICPCHGSRFDASTGQPVAGPAKKQLPPVNVTVRDSAVFGV
ncbi:twin-arginine translocation pathway signal protein [Frankia sp. CcI49]|uniref:Rieske (2Fe-2S) protein n=1 Tax=unclassified Frankia TaxID=2632575 RepID=UPI0006CA501F|nr:MULTISPECIES: Rieske (2Fe-2S) protein [unclassified Frankia]KPM54209.1 twin-arginine translocation pathway signal protein [Frankia sp. R43]ONH61636.1 twin-arginine translocation pathway signal protein [Frankia sp. CcI49]